MVVTDLLDQRNDIHDVAFIVGHSSTRTTPRSRRNVMRNLVERIRVNPDDGQPTASPACQKSPLILDRRQAPAIHGETCEAKLGGLKTRREAKSSLP